MRNVHLAFDVLEEIASNQPIGVSDIARNLALPKATVYRSLQVLQKTGWITSVDRGRPLWCLTIRPLSVGSLAINAQGPLRAISVPAMESLRRASGETIHLNVYYQSSTVLIERLDGLNPTRTFNALGGTVTLHPTAAGRMRLALMDEAERDEYFATVPASHPISLEDQRALRARLADFRAKGFAVTDGGLFSGVTAVAAPVFTRDGSPIAALSVSAPSDRLGPAKQTEYAGLLLDAARDVSAGLRLQA